MNRLKIMTYNVCWEAISAAKTYIDMTLCKTSSGISNNLCATNIAQIINTRLKQKYDFICLQEINKRMWNSMAPFLSLDNYRVMIREVYPSGIIIIYKDKYHPLYKYGGNLKGSRSDARPFIVSLFSNNIVLINMHLPHTKQTEAIERMKKKLSLLHPYTDDHTIFIICGDLNNSHPLYIPGFQNLLNDFDKKILNEPREIKTCCVPNGLTYTRSFDHIFISSNAQYIKYATIRKKEKYMSDHLPIFCEIII